MTEPLISVIIPVWNGESSIAATLDSIENQRFGLERCEVIVVDNGSTDGTAEIVGRYPRVKLLHEGRPGSYRARNRAIEAARGEYLLFTDGDCIADPDWIERAIAATQDLPAAGIYAGHVALFREGRTGPFTARFEELTAFNQESNVQWGFCVTANWLCRRDLMQAVGGFNADMLSGGDTECSKRFTAQGHSLVYVPDMIVRHPTRARLGDLIAKRRRVVGGRWVLEEYDRRSFSSVLANFAKEGRNQLSWIKNSAIENWAKPGVMFVSAALTLSSMFEAVRLKTGAAPYRS